MKLWRILRLALALTFLGLGIAQAEPPPPVAVGIYMPVLRDVPRKDAEVSLRFWVEELAQSIGLTYKPIRFYDTMEEMKNDVETGVLNFIVASSMGIVQHFSPNQLSDAFSGYKNSHDNLLLIVRRAASARTFSDLSGKRFAVLDQDELSEIYLQTLMMKTWRKAEESRFAALYRDKRSSNLVHRLFFDQSDAALVYRNTYEAALALNPQIEQRLQILDDYTFKGRSPYIGFFSSKLAPEHREVITAGAMKLNSTARGRQVLEIYKSDAMAPSKTQELEPFRELLATHRVLMAAALASPPKKAKR